MPFFSTIIPSYNRERLIAATLDSVLAQSDGDDEIIVADDGSTDGTMAVLERYRDRVTVLQQKNAGPGAARNLGASRASGEYISFLDSDDLWFPWTLATYRQVIEAEGRPSVVASLPFDFTDEATIAGVKPQPLRVTRHADFFASPPRWFFPSGMAVKTSEFRKAGGFTDAPCEDSDLWLRLGASPGFVVIDSPVGFAYREHVGGISKTQLYRSVGTRRLITEEKSGRYPGGPTRRRERAAYISMHARATSIYCLKQGLAGAGFGMYAAMLPWHLRLGRMKYLLAFPALAALNAPKFFKRALGGDRAH